MRYKKLRGEFLTMKLDLLIQLQSSGALKVKDGYTDDHATVGKLELNKEQCDFLAAKLGWVEMDLPSIQIIDKTNKFINTIKKYVDNQVILENTEVVFQNRRKLDTIKTFDRIKFICPPKFDITLLYGMPGTRSKYTIYSSVNMFNIPVKGCRSLKEVAIWINQLVR